MTMVRDLEAYPYLFSGVLWFSGLLLVVRSLPLASHRRLLVRLGLVMIPNFQFSLAHHDYWNRVRVGGRALGPEDVLFAFNVGAMGCLPAVLLYRHKLTVAEPLLGLRPDLWRFSAAGGIGFSLIYCGIVRTVFWIWPDFVSCWNSAPPWGLLLFGIPLGDIVWAASFGLFWPLFAGYVFDLRLSAAGQPARTAVCTASMSRAGEAPSRLRTPLA